MKKLYDFTLGLFVGFVLFFSIIFTINNNIDFNLKGNDSYIISLKENYIDEGYKVSFFNKDISDKVKVTNDIDINKVGIYYVNYDLDILNKSYNLKRKVEVIDNEIPLITLNGDDEISLYVGEEYIEKGVVATDNYDGDITSNVVTSGNVNTKEAGEYIISYTICDSSGNTNSISRKVNVKEKVIVKSNNNNNNNSSNNTLSNPITKYIIDNHYNVSVGYYNLVNGKSFYYKENKVYYGASLIKTLDAIYLYENNLVTEKLKPYIEKTISVSDNYSHKYLVNYIGRENLKEYGRNLGALNTLAGSDDFGSTTVKDQIVYLKKLYPLINNNEELKSYFINDYYNYLKLDNVTILHKYGWWNYWFHDVGIVLDNNPYIVVILTEHGEGSYDIINRLSKLVYEYHKGNI